MSVDPTADARDLYDRGQQHLNAGDPREAVECLTRAIALRPDVAVGYRVRAKALVELDRRTEALADLDRAVRLAPDDPAPLAERAELLFKQKAFPAAIADCDRVLTMDPGWAPVYGLRGECYAALGDSEAAFADFAQARAGDPDHAVDYLLAQANLRLDLERYRECIDDCDFLLRLAPDHPAALRTRGVALQGLGDLTGAETDFTRALELTPSATLTRLLRAIVRRDLGRTDEALADCDAVIDTGTAPPNAFVLRGGCRADRADFAGAIDDFTEAIRRHSAAPLPWLLRADAHERSGQIEMAVKDALEVLKRSPREAAAWNRLAWIWATSADPDIRDGERAKDFATRACELSEWGNPQHLDTLAAAHAAVGEFDTAMTWVERAIGLANETDAEAFREHFARFEARQALVLPAPQN